MAKLVTAFGRMNPPTTGHRKLVQKVNDVASENGAASRIYLSTTLGGHKNPLPPERKIVYARAIAGPGNFVHAPEGCPSLVHILGHLYRSNVTELWLVCGSDRVEEYERIFGRYDDVTVPNEDLFFHFPRWHVVSCGERDGDNPVSASLVRAHVNAMDYKGFLSMYPDTDPVTLYHLYGELSKIQSGINSASKRRVAQHETGREEEEGEARR